MEPRKDPTFRQVNDGLVDYYEKSSEDLSMLKEIDGNCSPPDKNISAYSGFDNNQDTKQLIQQVSLINNEKGNP